MILLNSYRLRKACAVNATSASLTPKTSCRAAPPSGNLVFPVLTGDLPNGLMPARVRLFPYGLGNAGDFFLVRVWGWTRLSSDLWLPAVLGEFLATIGTLTGAAGAAIGSTESFCHQIAFSNNVSEPTITADGRRRGTAILFNPGNNTPAYVEMAIRGSEYLEFDFSRLGSTPTMNSLVQMIEGVE